MVGSSLSATCETRTWTRTSELDVLPHDGEKEERKRTHAGVGVDVVEQDRDVALEQRDDVVVPVELARVARVGTGPPASAPVSSST